MPGRATSMCVRTGIQAMRAKAISPGPEKKKNKQARHACVRGVMSCALPLLPSPLLHGNAP